MSADSDKEALLQQRFFDFVRGDPWTDCHGVEHQGPETTCHEYRKKDTYDWWTRQTRIENDHGESGDEPSLVSRHYARPPHPMIEMTIPKDDHGRSRAIAHTSGPRPQHLKGKPRVQPSDAAWDIEASGREYGEDRREYDRNQKAVRVLAIAILEQEGIALGIE